MSKARPFAYHKRLLPGLLACTNVQCEVLWPVPIYRVKCLGQHHQFSMPGLPMSRVRPFGHFKGLVTDLLACTNVHCQVFCQGILARTSLLASRMSKAKSLGLYQWTRSFEQYHCPGLKNLLK